MNLPPLASWQGLALDDYFEQKLAISNGIAMSGVNPGHGCSSAVIYGIILMRYGG